MLVNYFLLHFNTTSSCTHARIIRAISHNNRRWNQNEILHTQQFQPISRAYVCSYNRSLIHLLLLLFCRPFHCHYFNSFVKTHQTMPYFSICFAVSYPFVLVCLFVYCCFFRVTWFVKIEPIYTLTFVPQNLCFCFSLNCFRLLCLCCGSISCAMLPVRKRKKIHPTTVQAYCRK